MMKRFFRIFIVLFISYSAVGQGVNPFDIFRSDDSLSTQEIDIISVENNFETTKIEGENPFDVSHIPIRKNQYEEIEKLTFKTKKNKETIALSYLPLWLIALSLCILAYMIYLKKDHLMILLRSLINSNFMRLSTYEQNGGKTPVYLMGYGLFVINIVLFTHLMLVKLFDVTIDYQFGKLLLFAIFFYGGKHVVNKFFAEIFFLTKENKIFDFTLITIYNILSVFFVVLNILIVFGPNVWLKVLTSFGIFIYIMFLLSRYYTELRLGRFYVNNYFIHFFIYFCAFEFSPWVVVYKFVKDLF